MLNYLKNHTKTKCVCLFEKTILFLFFPKGKRGKNMNEKEIIFPKTRRVRNCLN